MTSLSVSFLKIVQFRLSIRCQADPTRHRRSRRAGGRNFTTWLLARGGRLEQQNCSTLRLGDLSARSRDLLQPNNSFMKLSTLKTERPVTDKAHDYSPSGQSDKPVIDPDTGQPVVRDLRFHRFVAHQREFYFLNQHGGQ